MGRNVINKKNISIGMCYLVILIAAPLLTLNTLDSVLSERSVVQLLNELWASKNLKMLGMLLFLPVVISVINLVLLYTLLKGRQSHTLFNLIAGISIIIGVYLLVATNNLILPALVFLSLFTQISEKLFFKRNDGY